MMDVRALSANLRLLAGRWFVVVAMAVHVAACLLVMPPTLLLGGEPLLPGDFPMHAHRLHVYRSALRESGLPWGCDPALNAGLVVNPTGDIGTKALQIIGAVLPFVSASAIVRWFAFLALAGLPLGVLMACRTLRLPAAARHGALCSLLFLFWTNPNFVLTYRWGMISFAAASFFSPWVLAVAQRYAVEPERRNGWMFFAGLAVLFALHLLGPLMIAVPLVVLLSRRNGVTWKGNAAGLVFCAAAILANLFWVVPFFTGYLSDPSAWGNATLPGHARELTFASIAEMRMSDPHLRLASFIRGLLLLGAIPFTRMIAGKITGLVFGLAAAANFLIMLAGSFVPVLRHVQPLRFSLPWTAMICIPVGCFLAWLISAPARRFAPVVVVALAAAVAYSSAWKRPPAAGYDERVVLSITNDLPVRLQLGPPEAIEHIQSALPLARYIEKNTRPSDRILVQTRLKTDPEAYALWWNREVAGCAYPAITDPLHFDRKNLFGKPIIDWNSNQLREAVDLWGITKVVVWSPEAASAFLSALGKGEHVGEYTVFTVPDPPTRFLAGSGDVRASVNRIELTNLQPRDGMVVIRYRYHPAWRAEPSPEVIRHTVPGSGVGFIALRNPPACVTLAFDPTKVFHEPIFDPSP